MRSADPSARVVTLLEQLAQRLDCARDIAVDMQAQLVRGGTAEIEAGIARIETVAQEFKLLVEEYGRLPESAVRSEETAVARRALNRSAARIARSSAISGGLLERMIHISRRRLDLLNNAGEGTYLSNGRATEFDARGLRLKERV